MRRTAIRSSVAACLRVDCLQPLPTPEPLKSHLDVAVGSEARKPGRTALLRCASTGSERAGRRYTAWRRMVLDGERGVTRRAHAASATKMISPSAAAATM